MGISKNIKIAVTLIGLLIIVFIARHAIAEERGYPVKLKFGVAPQQSAVKLARHFIPLTEYLSRHAGIQIDFVTASNLKIFMERQASGEYDIAYVNAYHYIIANKKAGYYAFARPIEEFTGILVVRKDGHIKNIHDLKGKSIAFYDPTALATPLIKDYLYQKGIDVDKDMTVKWQITMDSVILSVFNRTTDIGGTTRRALRVMKNEVLDKLIILAETDPLPMHPFIAHPRVDHNIVNKIRETLIEMNKTAEGRKILEDIKIDGIQSAKDSDYEEMRRFAHRMKLPY